MVEPSVLAPSETSMNMQGFNCETFEMRLRFDPQEFSVDEFIKALEDRGISLQPDEAGDRKLSLSFYGNSEQKDSYHAHLNARLWNDGGGRIDLGLHVGTLEEAGLSPPPSAETCANWLGGFFENPVEGHIHAQYTFNKPFGPVITLPFPLVTTQKDLAGAFVSGLSLVLPNESETAIIQTASDTTYLFIRSQGLVKFDLKSFDLFSELEKLSPLVNKLVRKVD